MKAVKILAAGMSALMLLSITAGCAKKDEEEKTVREVIEEPVVAPNIAENDEIEYKEEFYFYDTKTQDQFMLGLTDTEFRLVKVTNAQEYSASLVQANGKYTVDENGNYVLDRYVERAGKLFLSEYLIDGETKTYIKPITLKKYGSIYLSDDGDFALIKKSESNGKFLWFKGNNENKLVLNKGEEITEIENAYLVDASTGVGTNIKLKAENFSELDTSKLGDATAKITYDNAEYTVSVDIKDPLSMISIPSKYQDLTVAEGLPVHVEKGTSYQDYFAKYQGSAPLFSCNGTAVTEYTVDGWDTQSVANGKEMYYRVKAEKDGVTYVFVGCVYVCASSEEIVKTVQSVAYEHEDVTKMDCGLWIVPKGQEISGVKGDISLLGTVTETGVELTVSEYDAGKLGAQRIKLTYNGATVEQMVYVFDETNAILSKTELVGLKLNAEGTAVDYSEALVKFAYCDGTYREAAVEGYKSSISEEVNADGSITVNFNYNATVEGIAYPFKTQVNVVPQVTE